MNFAFQIANLSQKNDWLHSFRILIGKANTALNSFKWEKFRSYTKNGKNKNVLLCDTRKKIRKI